MAPAASTSLTMVLNCGRVAWTTPCARGTWEKGGNCSNMISPLRSVSHLFLSYQHQSKNLSVYWNRLAFCFMYRSSHWATAQRVSGWLWAWRAAMWRCSTTPSRTSISSTCMRAVCCPSNSPTVVRHQAILGLPCLCELRAHWLLNWREKITALWLEIAYCISEITLIACFSLSTVFCLKLFGVYTWTASSNWAQPWLSSPFKPVFSLFAHISV